MDSQGTPCDTGTTNPIHVPSTNAAAVGSEVHAQGISMLHAPFFPGFPHHGGQMSFLFPHAFMPPRHGVGFPPHV